MPIGVYNTINSLLNEDMSLLTPYELPIEQLRLDLWVRNKNGVQIGPSIGDLMNYFSKTLLPNSNVPFKKLTPTEILNLSKSRKVALDGDTKGLLEYLVKTGQNLWSMNVPNFNSLKNDLRFASLKDGVNTAEIKNELNSIRIPSDKFENLERNLPSYAKLQIRTNNKLNITDLPSDVVQKLIHNDLIELSVQARNLVDQIWKEKIEDFNALKQLKNIVLTNNAKLTDLLSESIDKCSKIKGDLPSSMQFILNNKTLPSDVVKSVVHSKYHPMIGALEDKNSNVLVSSLPFFIQNQWEKLGLWMMPKVNELSQADKKIQIRKSFELNE